MDLESLAVQRQPSDLLSLRYSGILSPNLSVEAQYSAPASDIQPRGADDARSIDGTLLIDGSKNAALLEPDVLLRRLRRRREAR